MSVNQNKNENKNAMGEDTYAGALRAPRAGFPACVFAFVFVSIYVQFELRNGTIENSLTEPRHDKKSAYEKKT